MFPLHCDNCGRIIGRAERESFEGKTVCGRCLKKLGGGDAAEGGHLDWRLTVIIAAATAIVGGGVVYGLARLIVHFT